MPLVDKTYLNRTRKLSEEVYGKFKDQFTNDFAQNKDVLSKVAYIGSKRLRNEIAGYITSLIKRDTEENSETVEESPDVSDNTVSQ